MEIFNPSLWFICGSCRQAFPNTTTFVLHKLGNHLEECQGLQYVVFEESIVDREAQHKSKVGSSSRFHHYHSHDQSTSTAIPTFVQYLEHLQGKIKNENRNRMNIQTVHMDAITVNDTLETGESKGEYKKKKRKMSKIFRFREIPSEENVPDDDKNENREPVFENGLTEAFKSKKAATQILKIKVEAQDVFKTGDLEKKDGFTTPNPITVKFSASSDNLQLTKKQKQKKMETMKGKDKAMTFTCKYCSEYFETVEAKREHKKIHYAFGCRFCPAKFKTRVMYKRHRHTHRMASTKKCHVCDKLFRYKADFVNHKQSHVVEGPKCDVSDCSYSTKKASKLSKHIASKHTKTEEFHEEISTAVPIIEAWDSDLPPQQDDVSVDVPILCQSCDFYFGSERCLNQHVDIHCMKKPLRCPHCPVKFNRRKTLIRHGVVHGRDSSDKCIFCFKTYCNKA